MYSVNKTTKFHSRPHLHLLVPTSRNNMLPIRTESDRNNIIRVPSQRNLLPARHRPHLHQVVITSRNNMLPISWTEGDRINTTRMSSQRHNLLPRRHRPHIHQLVPTSRNNMLPSWTKGDRINIIRVSSQRRDNLHTFDTDGHLPSIYLHQPTVVYLLSLLPQQAREQVAQPPHKHQQKVNEGKERKPTETIPVPEEKK
jgi:hypothetical protein